MKLGSFQGPSELLDPFTQSMTPLPQPGPLEDCIRPRSQRPAGAPTNPPSPAVASDVPGKARSTAKWRPQKPKPNVPG